MTKLRLSYLGTCPGKRFTIEVKPFTIEVKPQMMRLALVFSPPQGVLMGKSCSGRVELSAFLTLSVCLCCGERVLTFTPFLGCWESLHLGKTSILGC